MGSTNAPAAPFPAEDSCQFAIELAMGCSVPGYKHATWNGYITASTNVLDQDPTFTTASVNDPVDPLVRGFCGPDSCAEEADYVGVAIAPDGKPWASFVDGCSGNCPTTSGDNQAALAIAHLFGLSLR